MIYRDLILNVAILLALSQLYSILLRNFQSDTWVRKIVVGMLFGVIAIVGMYMPFTYREGIIFDGRSAILSMAGYFGGWLTAGVSALISIGYRLFLGGSGTLPGVGFMLTSTLFGVGLHYVCEKYPRFSRPAYIYGFGILLHITMAGWILMLPNGQGIAAIRRLALPMMLILPLATLLLAILLEDQKKYLQAQSIISENESRYRALFDENYSVMLMIDPEDGQIVDANTAACQFYGWSYDQLTKKKVPEINLLTEDEVLREMKRAVRENRNYFVFDHQLANGEIRHVEVYSGPIEIRGRKVLYSIVHDITKRREVGWL